MKNFNIRGANKQDMPAVFAMIRELAEYEKEPDAVVFDEGEFLDTIFKQKRANILVAEINGALVGYAIYFYSFSTWLGKAGIYLEDLYVKPEFRAKGIGKAFFKELANKCAKDGLGRLEWACLHWNEPSIKFYESLNANNQSKEWRVYRLEGESLDKLKSV
ncbi:GNAT family N-acetyltransferase [Campylobacter sp. 19-13652]|uniref:GNAT family N-acetyltransferase n=1 Tax=Campylobacter sp. 19-13652 TaxID=2840180 RepID=UPI001C7655CD|nr:GNAT family N-acetyltransferase [Campylobacter sp. 19-13652]BCX79170.1 N-acetyltransferase [Campylobacter sp. 19-13652]